MDFGRFNSNLLEHDHLDQHLIAMGGSVSKLQKVTGFQGYFGFLS